MFFLSTYLCLGSSSGAAQSTPLGYKKPLNEEIYFVGNADKKGKGKKFGSKPSAQMSFEDPKPVPHSMVS